MFEQFYKSTGEEAWASVKDVVLALEQEIAFEVLTMQLMSILEWRILVTRPWACFNPDGHMMKCGQEHKQQQQAERNAYAKSGDTALNDARKRLAVRLPSLNSTNLLTHVCKLVPTHIACLRSLSRIYPRVPVIGG